MIKMMGMVSRYSTETAMGSLVLSDGDIREFTQDEWIDQEYEPGMGQQVLYKSDHNGTQIRIITQEEIEELKNNPIKEETPIETPAEEPSSDNTFPGIDETIEHYVSLGFKTATDRDIDGVRTISMRYYDAQSGDFGEAVISVNGSNIEVKETRNGKAV